eukprot:COSAG04_NODE_1595_length_6208_cov_1.762809_3_plen_216_part_00
MPWPTRSFATVSEAFFPTTHPSLAASRPVAGSEPDAARQPPSRRPARACKRLEFAWLRRLDRWLRVTQMSADGAGSQAGGGALPANASPSPGAPGLRGLGVAVWSHHPTRPARRLILCACGVADSHDGLVGQGDAPAAQHMQELRGAELRPPALFAGPVPPPAGPPARLRHALWPLARVLRNLRRATLRRWRPRSQTCRTACRLPPGAEPPDSML